MLKLDLQLFAEPEDKDKDKDKDKKTPKEGDMPEWAKNLQEQINQLKGSGGGGDLQKIPSTKPPADNTQQQPEEKKPEAQPTKSKSFLDWLMG